MRSPRFFYGWIIVGAGTLNSALLLGLVFYSFGGFMKPLTQELGRPATLVALGFSLQRLGSGLFSPLAGALIDRFGARFVGLVSGRRSTARPSCSSRASSSSGSFSSSVG